MRYFQLFILFGAVLGFSQASQAATLGECNQLASSLNEQLPQRVDRVTIWKTTACYQGTVRPILLYIYNIDAPSGVTTQSALNTLRSSQLQGWCTEPSQRALFKLVDVEYRYFDKQNTYVGANLYQNSMCQ